MKIPEQTDTDTHDFPPAPRIRVAAFISRVGRVLLLRQSRQDKTYWLLPGGGVERGETLVQAATREVREECGAEVTVVEAPLGLVEVISPDGGETRHLIQLMYPAFLNERSRPHPSDEAVKETAWFSPRQVRELELHPPIGDLLQKWLAALPNTSTLLREPEKAPQFSCPEPRWSP